MSFAAFEAVAHLFIDEGVRVPADGRRERNGRTAIPEVIVRRY